MRPYFFAAAVFSTGALAVVVACTPFDGTDGSAIPDPDGGASNASNDGGGGAAVDGPTPLSFCAGQGTFRLCDDFERSTVDGAWTFEQGTGDSRLDIDETISASSSRSLRLTLSGPTGFRYLHYPLPATRLIQVSFSMRFGGEVRGAQFAAIGFDDTPKNNVFVNWSVSDNEVSTLYLTEQDFPNGTEDADRHFSVQTGRPPVGMFVRYTLTVDLDKNEARVTSDDGSIAGTLALVIPHTKPALVKIGNVYATSRSEDDEVWFDDVVIR